MLGSRALHSSWLALFVALASVHCGGAGSDAPSPGGPSERPGNAEDPSPGGDSGAAVDIDGGADAAPDVTDADADADAGGLPPMTMPSFLVGYNEGWFGKSFGRDLTTAYDPAVVASTFDGLMTAGGRVVRMWLFEGRQGIVRGGGAPQIQGVDPQMLAHVGEMLDLARTRGLWVYLTLLDGNGMPEDAGPLRDFYWNLLNDQYGEGQAFQDHVLAPLLGVLDAHKDVIYGLDLINEIEAPRLRSFWPEPFLGPRAFLQRTTAFVKSKSPWLRVTSTAGWDLGALEISTGFFSGLGLDFYDLHVYADDGAIAGATDVCQRAAQDGVPVILGEFGQKSHVADDALQASTTAAFLANAKASCFEGALAWRYDAAESWWNYVRDDGSARPAVTTMQQVSAQP
jgi:hypothetical protein